MKHNVNTTSVSKAGVKVQIMQRSENGVLASPFFILYLLLISCVDK